MSVHLAERAAPFPLQLLHMAVEVRVVNVRRTTLAIGSPQVPVGLVDPGAGQAVHT